MTVAVLSQFDRARPSWPFLHQGRIWKITVPLGGWGAISRGKSRPRQHFIHPLGVIQNPRPGPHPSPPPPASSKNPGRSLSLSSSSSRPPPRFSSHPLRSPRRPTPKTLTLAHPRPRAQATAPGHGRRRHAPLAGGRVPGLPRAPCRHDQGAHHRYVPPLPPSISPPLRRWILNGFGGSWGSGAFDRWVPGWLIWFILLEFFWQTWRSSTSSATQVSSRPRSLLRFAVLESRIRVIRWRSCRNDWALEEVDWGRSLWFLC
jgi:hypothetical protein